VNWPASPDGDELEDAMPKVSPEIAAEASVWVAQPHGPVDRARWNGTASLGKRCLRPIARRSSAALQLHFSDNLVHGLPSSMATD
jgi:hypothetical protein